MKYFSYISALFLASTFALASCSQVEELEGEKEDSISTLKLGVSDAGFLNSERAVYDAYKTKFTEGDEVGVFAVKGGVIVEDINNRRFVVKEGMWELDDEGDVIEYKGSEFKKMKFYAYYPYNANVKIDPTAEDPFVNVVKNWTVGADQSGDNYGKYDLMTSVGEAEGQRLQGKIEFKMQHRMGLAIIKMPYLIYSFTNGGIDDYNMPIPMGDLSINGTVAQPRYDKSTNTYMMLVKPETKFTIEGTYSGVKEMTYKVEGTLSKATAKQYTINDESKLLYTLAVGDYFCADGRIVSQDVETAPDNVIGIVCYAGNPQPHITHPNNNNETNDALFRDYPGCKHGLVLALNDSKGTTSKFSAPGIFSAWFSTDDDWKDKFTGCNTNNATDPSVMFPGYKGYNNTTLLTMCYENGSTAACDPAYNYIMTYREEVPTPMSTSPWYIPSLAELYVVAEKMGALNSSINVAKGTLLASTNKGELTRFYWSSNERNNAFMWLHHMAGGSEFLNRERDSRAGYFRMMLAF